MYCTEKTTTQTLHMITPHEHETNTNLKDLKIGQIQTQKKNCKKRKTKIFTKNFTNEIKNITINHTQLLLYYSSLDALVQFLFTNNFCSQSLT